MFDEDSLPDRFKKVILKSVDILLDFETMKNLTDTAINWATEIVSAVMLEKCCCKNSEVECYFCQIRNEILQKLEEEQ